MRHGFIELVFLLVCPLADKTEVNQTTIKFICVIRHSLASEVLQYFCPPSVYKHLQLSVNGIVSAMSVSTGKVLDFQVMSRKCKSCESHKGMDQTSATFGLEAGP